MITLTYCYVCPHRCGVDRPENMNDTSPDKYFGSCGCGMLPIVARAGLHMWEEPCISGTKGSGTVFFSGCNLHCVFCQNFDISCKGFGKEIPIERLQEIYQELNQSIMFIPCSFICSRFIYWLQKRSVSKK